MSPDTGPQADFPARTPQRLKVSFEFFPPKNEEMERQLWQALQRLAEDRKPAPRRGFRCLVLSPTRELATMAGAVVA